MKKKELAATFDGLADAMSDIDVREMVERAERASGEKRCSRYRDKAVEKTVELLEAAAVGYITGMCDAHDITLGYDEDATEDPREYVKQALYRTANAYSKAHMQEMLDRMRELYDAMGMGE